MGGGVPVLSVACSSKLLFFQPEEEDMKKITMNLARAEDVVCHAMQSCHVFRSSVQWARHSSCRAWCCKSWHEHLL